MKRLLHYARRAWELPPKEAFNAAWELGALRVGQFRHRLDQSPRDPYGLARFEKAAPHRDGSQLLRSPAVLPISAAGDLQPADSGRLREVADAALAHRFDLLGSGPMVPHYGFRAPGIEGVRYDMPAPPHAAELQITRMRTLSPDTPADYQPIDWHIDLRSGFRWPEAEWCTAIEFGTVRGADIKLPWELSRCQHLPPLALASRLGLVDGAVEVRTQITDWIAANPVGRGVNWVCAMDVSIRAVSWLCAIELLQDDPAITPGFRRLLAASLYTHGRHIERNLEYHRHETGNHYLSDVVGLLCIGAALPGLPDADRWCAFAIQELVSEASRQILPDGWQIEGSAAYLHLVGELFLLGTLVALRLPSERRSTLAKLPAARMRHLLAPPLREPGQRGFDDSPAVFPTAFFDALCAVLTAAAAVTRPDGRVAQVGDNDSGRIWRLTSLTPPPACGADDDGLDRRTLLAVGGRLFGNEAIEDAGASFALDADLLTRGVPFDAVQQRMSPRAPTPGRAAILQHAGIAVLSTPRAHLVISYGTIPRNCSGGHFHNDIGGFEMSLDGLPVVVNPGSYVYTPLPDRRNEFRSEHAHSTVAVDGVRQREWPGTEGVLFRVLRDAHAQGGQRDDGAFTTRAEYADVVHERTFSWPADDVLLITDTVLSARAAMSTLNLDPGVAVRRQPDDTWDLVRDGRVIAHVEFESMMNVTADAGRYSHGYGRRVDNVRLTARLVDGAGRIRISFAAEDR